MEPKLDGTYDCACLSNDDEDEVKRRGQWWVKQGSGGGVRGEWVAPERGLNDLIWGGGGGVGVQYYYYYYYY